MLIEVPRTHAGFIEWLVGRHPDLTPLLQEHLSDMDGELLAHLLLGDVTRYAADLARRAPDDTEADAKLGSLLQDLDLAILQLDSEDDPRKRDPVGNLVGVSFVENTQGLPGDEDEPLRERLRAFPNLAQALSQ